MPPSCRKSLLFLLCLILAPVVANAAATVTITPGYTNVAVRGTVQYTAAVTGVTSTAVTWEVNGVAGGNAMLGTISTTGLYTAPTAVPAVSTLIEALASDGKTMGVVYVNVEAVGPGIASVSPNPVPTGNYAVVLTGAGFKSGATVSVNGDNVTTTFVSATSLKASGYQGTATASVFRVANPGTTFGPALTVPFVSKSQSPQAISPKSTTVVLGQTKQFTSSEATGWTATAGTVSPAGLFTAPATMPASHAAIVTATGPGGSASATVTLVPIPAQAIAPTTVTLDLGVAQQFTSAGATSWSATAGAVTSAGLYTAPTAEPTGGTAMVTAIGPGGSASAAITVVNSKPVTISPTSASVTLGATRQFTASGGTAWAATYGKVDGAGLYMAPASMPAGNADSVSVTGIGGTAKAAISLVYPAPAITGVGTGGRLPLGVFTATVTGAGFVSGSGASLNGSALATKYASPTLLTISGFAGVSGTGTITVSNAATASAPFTVQVGVANAQVSPAAARRFLEQAAFGPTPTDATSVQTLGFQPWINNQFSLAQVSNYDTVIPNNISMPAQFLANAVSNQDQLRQRTAFALSQIFVTSLDKLIFDDDMVPYQDMLLADSLGNYRQIMEDVTLSSAMGQYLDMGNNAAADPATGAVANENYARELMQLFTIGTVMLNQDGSVQVDGNQIPIPTYSQFTVTEFARVYTGWTYAPNAGNAPYWGEYFTPGNMIPWAPKHDAGSKQLLNGYVAPAGRTPQQDLDGALDNIFNHPNVGPFVGRLLIQHLVKSNPSPAYISRVAGVFDDNGSGVRGDMKAVITAILMDPEARTNDNGGSDQPGDGHLQEPALFMAGMVRAFGGQMNTQNYYSSDLASMGEDVFSSPSVFNYYAPTYVVPGTSTMGGEFQIYSPNNAIIRNNEVSDLFSQYSSAVQNYGPGTTIDLTPFLTLATNPATLVNALDLTLTHGVMPTAMKSEIVAAVNAETGGALRQVQVGCYLILSSNYYNVWH
jgi:uncharacterized protein (DUF1800 family)